MFFYLWPFYITSINIGVILCLCSQRCFTCGPVFLPSNCEASCWALSWILSTYKGIWSSESRGPAGSCREMDDSITGGHDRCYFYRSVRRPLIHALMSECMRRTKVISEFQYTTLTLTFLKEWGEDRGGSGLSVRPRDNFHCSKKNLDGFFLGSRGERGIDERRS